MTGLPHEPGRAGRGRVVLAGESGALDRLHEALAPRAIRVGNVFMALGEIASANATEPVDMVILTRDLVNDQADRMVRSLRQVDRAVRIALLLSDAPATALERATFDICLHPRVRAEEIEAMLNGGPAPAHESPETARDAAADDEQSETHDREFDTAAAATEPAHEAACADADRTSNAESTGSMGDTDLVEALLEADESDDRFIDIALAIIGEQTGWADIRLAPDECETTEDGVTIVFAGRALGRLHAPGAPANELRSWADWLARWLALAASMRELRQRAMQDELTGAWNRRYFNAFLSETIARAAARRRPVTVMVFDLDDFKRYNDTFGHAAGDEILRESVRLLNSAIRKGDRVCRIGGDEFAVIFADLEGPREAGSAHPETVEQIAQRFQNEICRMRFPKLGIEAPGDLSISAGLATFPWDGHDPTSLLEHADQLTLQSKRRGKNAITLGPGAQRLCEERGEDA